MQGAPAPRELGRRCTPTFDRSVADLASLRLRGGGDAGPALRGRDAVVHGRLRARHADHVPADAALRPRARAQRAARARHAPGDGGRPDARRRAGQDRPRGAHGQGRERPGSRATTARWTRRRSSSSSSRSCGAGRTTRRSCARCASRRCARSTGSTSTATSTATGSSSTSAARERGLENQSWKDSRQLAALPRRSPGEPPIAPCEVQGYVYDAKARMAELAREVWRDRDARRAARARGGRAARALRRGVLVRGARRVLRARARRRQAPGRLAHVEHRASPLERDRPGQAGRRDRRPADGRRALVGLGRPHDVRRRTPATARSRTTTGRSGPTTIP